MTTSTPGRMPVIAFSDDADYGTLLGVLQLFNFMGHGWCVCIVKKDGTRVEVALLDAPEPDYIGGFTFIEGGDWSGPKVFVHLDAVAQIIVL
jgi:hypothetical protein